MEVDRDRDMAGKIRTSLIYKNKSLPTKRIRRIVIVPQVEVTTSFLFLSNIYINLERGYHHIELTLRRGNPHTESDNPRTCPILNIITVIAKCMQTWQS